MNEINEIHCSQKPILQRKGVAVDKKKIPATNFDAIKAYSDAKTAEIRTGINIFEDKKALEKLVEYNFLIRQKPKKLCWTETLCFNAIFHISLIVFTG